MKIPKSVHAKLSKPKKKSPIFFEKTQSKRISKRKPTAIIKKQTPVFKSKKITKNSLKKTATQKSTSSNKDNPKQKLAKPFKLQKKIPKILESTLPPEQERLEKYMAQSGMASRREAKDLIKKGLVTIDGKVIKNPGHGIIVGKTVVKIAGGFAQHKETILLYKPRGIETSKTSPDAIDIHDKFPQFTHLAPIGRLDKDSEGLILLSNDGVLAKIITDEQSTIDKEYQVTVREDVMPVLLSKMEHGINLDGEITKPCITSKLSRNQYTITLHEGRKHQVRRMANACKFTVTKLVRIRIGELKIGKMTAGNFKKIPQDIVEQMKKK
jgi:23S rRNA pseudouridine2604 synthase